MERARMPGGRKEKNFESQELFVEEGTGMNWVGRESTRKIVLTKLKPSTSASSTQRSSSSATWEAVPTGVEPSPPTVISVATVFLVHFLTDGEVWENASTADLKD